MKEQKSIIRTLTNRGFKANKMRNLIAAFAIILTTMMFTSLFVLSQSMAENLRNMNFQQAGYNSHLSSSTMTDADVEKITSHEAVRDFGKSIVVGIAERNPLCGRKLCPFQLFLSHNGNHAGTGKRDCFGHHYP